MEIDVALGIVWFVCFLFSITCHEAAHALAAKWGGDLTAYESGQVTLNPLPHVQREPLGTILVPILSYVFMGWMMGFASAPYDPRWADRYPKRAGLMALAGPMANLAIAILAGVVMKVLLTAGVLEVGRPGVTHIVMGTDPSVQSPLAIALSILFSLNLILAVFNLIPVPPLDGIAVLGLFLPDHWTRKVQEVMGSGPFRLVGLFLAWRLAGYILAPVLLAAIRILYS